MENTHLHPDMQVLIDARDGAGEKGDTPEEQRRFWTAYTTATNRPAPADMAIMDEIVATDDHPTPVRIYRPAGAPEDAPAIIYMHGGGFMLGDLDSSDSVAWGLAEGPRGGILPNRNKVRANS